MRVIAGQWRGRRLKAPVGREVRPTTDRTKEALFNILGSEVSGCVVLDLCCGAGGLGLEALSRGAAKAIFVDKAASSLAATQANLELCGAEADCYRLESGDAMSWLHRWSGPKTEPWILICDPPYQTAMVGTMIKFLDDGEYPAGLLCAVVEYGAETAGLPEMGPLWQTRKYGKSRLAILRPGAKAPDQENLL